MNRHKCIGIALSIVFILLATACGSNQNATRTSPVQTGSTAYPVTITNYDYVENKIDFTYHKTPERVIVTHPGATELLLDLGLESRILATIAPYGSPVARIAEKYTRLNVLRAPYMPSEEELLELQPDMIIGWSQQFSPTGMGEVKTWQARNVGTFILSSTLLKTKPTLETTVYSNIEDIGRIFNIQPVTGPYIQNFKTRVAKVESLVKDLPRKKTVLILQDHFNSTFSLYDSQYLISHMVELAGGINLCENKTSFVGAEKVLAFDPDFIIFVSVNKNNFAEDLSNEEAINSLRALSELRGMRAIQNGNIINLPFFTVNNGGIRTIDAIEKIAVNLYPDKFN
jgi:iron complex transport system substrate-binding protein